MNIWDEASAAGVWLCRTELAGKSPGMAHSGTAEGFGARETCRLVLASLRTHLGEAGAHLVVLVVSLTLRSDESIHTCTEVWPDAASSITAAVDTDGLSTHSARVAFRA